MALPGLDLEPGSVLEALPPSVRPEGAGSEVLLQARYYAVPAPQGANRSRGRWALRARREEGGWIATVKGPDRRAGGVFSRTEVNAPLSAPPSAGDKLPGRLREVLGGAGIALSTWPRPLFSSEIQRHAVVLESDLGRAEMALDRGRIEAASKEHRICELELELLEGGADTLVQALLALAERLAIRPGVWSKTAVGMWLLGVLPPRPRRAGADAQELWNLLLDLEEHIRHGRDDLRPHRSSVLAELQVALGGDALSLDEPSHPEEWDCPQRAQRQWALWARVLDVED